MKIKLVNLKKNYTDKGYFILKNYLDQKFIDKLISEINSAEKTIKYTDNKGNLRRIEKVYDKGENLKNLNFKILKILKYIFKKNFVIFKDKFNAKPPGGEGFFAHFDGIFNFIDQNDNKRKGWYEYGDFFINVLIALDKCNKKNGSIELANAFKNDFEKLLEITKKNGTPAIKKEVEIDLNFKLINLNVGDIVFFSNTCPHRSKKNNSNSSRRILYYTYSLEKNGSKYELYFKDKKKSKNLSKALAEK